jgi:hypothetical protein
MTLEWKDPPSSCQRRTGGDWGKVAADLRANPGQWAIVLTDTRERCNTRRQTIVQGRMTVFQPAGSFQSVTRANDDGTVSTYARYVGDE